MRRAALLLLVLGGCFSYGGDTAPLPEECEATIDCPSGEFCRAGLCYGNPPDLGFAAQITPPETRPDLPISEVEVLAVADDGVVELGFEESAEVRGRVVFPPLTTSVRARLRFSRPSRIPGAPPIQVETLAEAGKSPGQYAFKVRLGLTRDAETWKVDIIPDAETVVAGLDKTLAEAAPARRLEMTVTRDVFIDLPVVDAEGLKPISGTVVDAAGRGLEGMRVTAYGRPDATSPLETGSSVTRTDAEGNFVIWVPVSWENLFDLVAEPTAGIKAPAVRRRGVEISDELQSAQLIELRLPSHPSPAPFELPVHSKAPSGGNAPAVGAQVTFEALLEGTDDDVIYRASAVVAADGRVRVDLVPGDLDGNLTYKVRVLPPYDTPHASVWAAEVAVGPATAEGSGGVLPDLVLPRRVLLTGRIVDSTGLPVPEVAVRPALSPVFTLAASAEEQLLLRAVRPVEVTSNADGRFQTYVDPLLLGRTAVWDLELVPAAGSRLPRWARDHIAVGAGMPAEDLGELPLPRAALAEARLHDAGGNLVAGAEVRVWVPALDNSLCVVDLADDCQVPARLRVLATTGSAGRALLPLPAP